MSQWLELVLVVVVAVVAAGLIPALVAGRVLHARDGYVPWQFGGRRRV